jgi:hypothetical protein
MFSRLSRFTPIVAKRSLAATASLSRAHAKSRNTVFMVGGAAFIGTAVTVGVAANDGINYEAIKKDISDAIDADEAKRDNGTSIGPTLVRLAWHAAGTYNAADKTGTSPTVPSISTPTHDCY